MRKPLIKPAGYYHVQRTVSDLKRSVDFYTTVLGFKFVHGTSESAWLNSDMLVLTLSPGEVVVDLGSYFGWVVGDAGELEQLYEQLFRGNQRLSGPPDTSVGRSFFFLYDPDDYPIALSAAMLGM